MTRFHSVSALLKKAISLLLLLITVASTDFASDQYSHEPQALARLIAATEQYGEPLRSMRDESTSYYIRSAEYVGLCEAPFGRVHIARLFYIRSAAPGSKAPPRGHTFVVFADNQFRIRAFWRTDFAETGLSVSGSTLSRGEETLLDFNQLPALGTVLIDGKPQTIPRWK